MISTVTTRPHGIGPSVGLKPTLLSPRQIMEQLNGLSLSGGDIARAADKMLNLAGNGDALSPELQQALSLLLQEASGDGPALASGLSRLLGQFSAPESGDLPALKDLAQLLGARLAGSGDGKLEKQALSLLRQLSQGNVGNDVSRQLKAVLQQLRQSDALSALPKGNDTLQTLLQQVKQELGAAHLPDAALAKNVPEFALRVHQQLFSDDGGGQAQLFIPVRERQEQQQQQQHQQPEEHDEEVVQGVRATGQRFSVAQNGSENTTVSSSTGPSTSGKLYQGDSVFSYGLSVLFLFMQMLSDQANASYADMEKNSAISRDAQNYASQVDAVLAQLSAKGDSKAKADIPDDVKKYLEENHIAIDGVCGFDDSGKWGWADDKGHISAGNPAKKSFDQGQITAIKGALDNIGNRASDFISTAQLQLQKMMQTYNVCVSLINSLQSMLSDMNKTIAQGIR